MCTTDPTPPETLAPPLAAAARSTDDAALIVRAQAGDDDAWAELLGRYLPRLRGWLRQRCGDDMAEQVESDVLYHLVRAMPAYEERGFPFSAWLFRIARAKLVDNQRIAVRAMRHTTGLSESIGTVERGYAAVEHADTIAHVWQAIEALPRRQRVTLRAIYGNDYLVVRAA